MNAQKFEWLKVSAANISRKGWELIMAGICLDSKNFAALSIAG